MNNTNLFKSEKDELFERFGGYTISDTVYHGPLSETVLKSGRTMKYFRDDLNGSIVLVEIKDLLCG